MTTVTAHHITLAAAELRRTHPKAPAVDLLDLRVGSEEAGQRQSFPVALLHRRTPPGQLIAEAFDRTGPDAISKVAAALLPVWQADVLLKFETRHGVVVE